MPSRLFYALILFLPLISACVTGGQRSSLPTHIAGMEPDSGIAVTFAQPVDALRQSTITRILEKGQAGEEAGILVSAPYMAASGELCALVSSQATAEHWIACRQNKSQWIVKPAMLREDAMYGTIK